MNRKHRVLCNLLSGGVVDTTAPTVTITCTQGASGSATATTPLNFTFTFSEVVTGFAVGDITVGNGSAGNFAGSGTTYTADITPTAIGAVTVDVGAAVCVDGAGNGNAAATQFTITYNSLLDAVAYWKLDEASDGSAAVTRVDSKGANHLTDISPYAASGTGKLGNCVTLVRTNSEHLSIADNAALSLEGGSYAIMAWINVADNTYSTLISKATTVHEYFLQAHNTLGFYFAGLAYVGSVPTAGTWYCVVAEYNSGDNKCRLYINNGAATGSQVATGGAASAGTGNFYIGRGVTSGERYFSGSVDNVVILKGRVTTAAERTWFYNSGNGNVLP